MNPEQPLFNPFTKMKYARTPFMPGVVLESTLLLMGPRHFLEPGISGFCLFDDGAIAVFYDQEMIGGCFRLGYRYQGPKGLLIRAAPQLVIFSGEVALLPALSLGYSF